MPTRLAFRVQYVIPALVAVWAFFGLNGLADRAEQQRHLHELQRRQGRPGDTLHLAGLDNVQRVSGKLFSGSSPESDDGFRSLHLLGIRTVVSVDGARPDIDAARRFGLRYVHLPIGYDGVPEERVLQLAKATLELPGPIYLHCHHGKHRGPAAAAVALLVSEPACSASDAVAYLKNAGADPRYVGLYRSVQSLKRPRQADYSDAKIELPETANVGAMTERMVQIDERWENLQLAKSAGWKTQATHPDLDPAHEALQLAELYREAGRNDKANQRGEPFGTLLNEAERGAAELESAIRQGRFAEATRLLGAVGQACASCHAKFRDAPR